MFIKFKKEHSAGIRKGEFRKVQLGFGKRMIKEGFAEEAEEKDFQAWKESLKGGVKEEAKKEEEKAGEKKATTSKKKEKKA